MKITKAEKLLSVKVLNPKQLLTHVLPVMLLLLNITGDGYNNKTIISILNLLISSVIWIKNFKM